MRKMLASVLAVVAGAGVFVADASAWSFKEHIQFTRLAVMRIVNDPAAPADLKQWLTAQTPLLASMDAEREFFMTARVGEKPDASKLSGLTWWVCVPDLVALERNNQPAEPSGKHERLNHFIDLEFLNPAGPTRTFQKDLSALPDAKSISRDIKNESYVRAGYLPFAKEHAYRKLVAAIKAGRLTPDPAKPEDQDHALRWAGYLAHYAQDNTQPHHATMDYKSAQYFPGLKNSPNVHAEVEYRMGDDEANPFTALRTEYWAAFEKELAAAKDPTPTDDLFDGVVHIAFKSYRNLPLIGEAAAASLIPATGEAKPSIDTEKFFRFEGSVDGVKMTVLQMKAHQTAWAIARTERVLRQAWAEAHAK